MFPFRLQCPRTVASFGLDGFLLDGGSHHTFFCMRAFWIRGVAFSLAVALGLVAIWVSSPAVRTRLCPSHIRTLPPLFVSNKYRF